MPLPRSDGGPCACSSLLSPVISKSWMTGTGSACSLTFSEHKRSHRKSNDMGAPAQTYRRACRRHALGECSPCSRKFAITHIDFGQEQLLIVASSACAKMHKQVCREQQSRLQCLEEQPAGDAPQEFLLAVACSGASAQYGSETCSGFGQEPRRSQPEEMKGFSHSPPLVR